ncbi:peptidase M16 [Aureimonas sp. SA4125]|uniref:M16 family metallopeptidase n=1 Tax=Aureimonas sp. SA4125 TaxID=2826993 RepID=UPI001CC827C8|nr:pitrilysin family protein [Aureimonas sp. SA4125]BDA82821.1 peptidase M16 [Aureimonas sp. SA4125]
MTLFKRPLSTATALFLTAGISLAAMAPAEAVDIKEVVSPGGIKALLVEDYTNPLIAVNFAFEGAGSTADAPGKEGTGNLMSGLLDEGAGDITSQAFQEKLDTLGVSLSYSASYDNFTGSFRTLVENEADAFELLRLSVNQPRFDEEPVSRIRGQIETGIIANENDPGELVSKAWRETAFPGHPYARPSDGTVASLDKVTREDLETYRKNGFARDNLVIGVVGAIDAVELGKQLDAVFGALPATATLPDIPDVAPVAGKTASVTLDVPQTTIQFVLPGVKRDDKDFFPAYLMNHILGGGSFSSRLYQEVREKRGLAYGANSFLASFDHSAVLGASTATRADKAQESIDIIRQEMKRMADEGPTPEELDRAKAYVKGSYAIQNLDSSLSIASTLVGIQLDNLGIDYIDKRQDLIDAVTLEDVRRIAKALLSVEPTVVTVGPAGA